MSAQRCDELRLTGSGGANRVMEAEFKRLVMRSPFDIRVEKPKREGEATLLYPFEARAAWVAACYHRTSSRITWDLCSSDAVRVEPLFADLVPVLSADDRLPDENLPFSVEVGSASDFAASSRTRLSKRSRRGASPRNWMRNHRTSCSWCGGPEFPKRDTPASVSISEAERVIADQDVRLLTPEYVHRMLPAAHDMKPGVFCFNPPYGVRMSAGDEKRLLALYSDMGRVLSRFSGWRAACFVANPRFEEMFGHA